MKCLSIHRGVIGALICLQLAVAATGSAWTASPHSAKRANHAEEAGKEKSDAKKPFASSGPGVKPGDWEPFIDPEKQIFPSLLLASATLKDPLRDTKTAEKTEKDDQRHKASADHVKPDETPTTFGDENGLMGIAVISPANGAHARMEIKENALLSPVVLEADLPAKGREYHLLPRIDYKYEALNRVRQSVPVNVTFALQIDGKSLGERFVTARVHPINDCPYAYQNPENEKDYVDIAWMFAAYVNEDHPLLPDLLKDAQATGIVDGFDAYQSHDPGTVLLQLFSVWQALRQHHIKYSDIGTTTDESLSLYSLHVRFIEEALAEAHANCVDASVLLASMLRRMGIDSFLVLEPGHMFLGVYLDSQGKQSVCLETTLLGDADPTRFVENRYLTKAASRKIKAMPGWRCFNAALDSATKEFKKHRQHFQKANDPEYEMIDIAAARREGIAPIGYLKAD